MTGFAGQFESLTICAGHVDTAFPALKGSADNNGIVRNMVNIIERKGESESGSGGKGALEQIKTVGKGRMVEAARNGGRDGLIGGSGKSLGNKGLVDGHGHVHDQKHERAHTCLSSVAAPRGSSPVVHSHENAVLKTTPTTTKTTTNIAHNPTTHIDHNFDSLDIPISDLLISRRPHDHDHDHDHDHSLTEPHAPTTDAPYSPTTGLANVGRKLEVQSLSGLMTSPRKS